MNNILVLCLCLFSINAFAGQAASELDKFGAALSKTTNGVISFKKAIHTMSAPMNSYKLVFVTDNKDLMASPNAKNGNAAYIQNLMRTEIWQAKFCNVSLRSIFKQHSIDFIYGDLTSVSGKTQSMAICVKSDLSGKPY